MGNDFNINFNENKTINAVLFILERIDRKDFHKIFKILYFADRNHFADYGRPISGDTYIKMEDGPVPSNLYDIFKSVRGNGYYKDVDGKFTQYFSVQDWSFLKANKSPNLNSLSKTDIDYLNKSIDDFGGLDYHEIREKSHDYAWENSVLNREISFNDILREKGVDDGFINILKERANITKIIDNASS